MLSAHIYLMLGRIDRRLVNVELDTGAELAPRQHGPQHWPRQADGGGRGWRGESCARTDGRTPRGSIIDIKAATSQKRVLNSLGRNNLYDA